MNERTKWLPYAAGKVYGAVVTLLLGTLFLAHVACPERDRLSKEQAKAVMVEAQKLEEQNKLQEAYYKYKNVETSYEVNDELRSAAWHDVQRIRLLVSKQQKEIEIVLSRYFAEKGTYPDSLSAISDQLTDTTRAAVGGFRYMRLSDTQFKLEDGIIG
jgi:hypothetical protein